ncbi:MAG TPA: hypothetical protein ENI93_06730 [Gammaproteobacteria bacterium]|nr:hypothetical protein [Gammaproteobacteria bacterium]
MKRYPAFVIPLVLYLLAGGVAMSAEALTVQTVRLSHQPAENILPLVRGVLPPGAAVEGQGDTIVIRARKADLPALAELVAELDTPLHQFEILVSLDPAVLQSNLPKPPPAPEADTAYEDRIRITKSGEPRSSVKTYRTRGRKLAPQTYAVRVLEGKWATIKTGKSIPVGSRRVNPDGTVTESIEYRQLDSGLRIRPRLVGGKVVLDIQPFDETESRSGGGRLQQHMASTTVSVAPGEWIALGAVSGQPRPVTRGKVYGTHREHPDDYDLFVKVDVVPDNG